MEQKRITNKINSSFNVNELNRFTINGEIGEITFYGKNLTLEEAQAKYDKQVELSRNFWNDCKETYYTKDTPLTYM